MPRLLKEREVDRDLWEALNFSMRDDEDLLVALDDMLHQGAADVEQTAEVDRIASEMEERARTRASAAEHELSMARHELQMAHAQRITTKKLHAAAKQREEREAKIVKALRLHTARTRNGIVEWARFKDFTSDQLPELQLMANGGLKKLLNAHRRARPAEPETPMSISEAEAI